jgi:hypothetical protein
MKRKSFLESPSCNPQLLINAVTGNWERDQALDRYCDFRELDATRFS